MASEPSNSSDLVNRRKRAGYRAHHRGTQEMDIILGGYADAHLDTFGAAEIDRFERLLDEPDTDLLKWIIGQAPIPGDADRELIAKITAFQRERNFRS